MMKKVIVTLVAGLLLVPALGFANPGPDMMKHARMGSRLVEKNMFPPKMLLRHQDEIGLTEDQVTKIEKMQQKFQEYEIKQKAEMKIQWLKFKTLLKKDKVDRKKMEKMIRETARMRTNMQIDKMNYMLDVKEVLTPEQITKIKEFKKKMRKRRWSKGMKRGKRGKGMRGNRPMARRGGYNEPVGQPVDGETVSE